MDNFVHLTDALNNSSLECFGKRNDAYLKIVMENDEKCQKFILFDAQNPADVAETLGGICQMLRENKLGLQYVLYVDVNETGLFLFNELLLMTRQFLSFVGFFVDK